MLKNKFSLAVGATVLALASASAQATYCHPGSTTVNWVGGCDGTTNFTFSKAFGQINAAAASSQDVGDNLSLKLASFNQSGKNGVLFLLQNNNLNWTSGSKTYDTSIANVYFDVGNNLVANNNDIYTNGMSIQQDSGWGVDFTELRQNNANFEMPAVPANGFDADYSFASTGWFDSSRVSSGVNTTSEYVMFWGVLNNGKNFNDVFNAVADGSFRIGINLITLVTDKNYCVDDQIIRTNYLSDKCFSTVPVPAAAWLFGSALLGFVTISNRRRV